MGSYLNPGNSGFKEMRNGIYMDKSGLIGLINHTINTNEKLTCVSRPRRFGKSFAAKMLCAYYDKTCDSSGLFDDLAIASDPRYTDSYRKHLNQYDVIYLDMTAVIGEAGIAELVSYMKRNVMKELSEAYPGLKQEEGFVPTLANAVDVTGNKFVVIIDEWDAPIREAKDEPRIQREYLEFLRSLFKNSGSTAKVFAAAYMTGILPIKKDGSHKVNSAEGRREGPLGGAAISDFQEYSVIAPMEFAEYLGFTEDEVKQLCAEYGGDFSKMKLWYDGYEQENVGAVYNPNSVMKAIRNHKFRSYWTETSAAASLMGYISLDFDGLSRTITELLGGGEIKVDTLGFANDLVTFRNRDDVLTLLIHLGYLTYNESTEKARIPNEEIRLEFAKTIRQVERKDTIRRVQESDQLIQDTVHRDADAVAAQIERIHEEEASLYYNSEQALRSVIKRAYFSSVDEYVMLEEVPAGVGFADILYLPKKDSPLPALVVELKWNQSAEGAIAQIKDRKYPKVLEGYGGEILLVGIAYDKDARPGQRRHSCVIEVWR